MGAVLKFPARKARPSAPQLTDAEISAMLDEAWPEWERVFAPPAPGKVKIIPRKVGFCHSVRYGLNEEQKWTERQVEEMVERFWVEAYRRCVAQWGPQAPSA